MYPDGFYEYQDGYPNYYQAQGNWSWLSILALLVLAAIFFALSDSLNKSELNNNRISNNNNNGVAEYWYSDTPDQINNSSISGTNRQYVSKAEVADKNDLSRNRPNSANTTSSFNAMFFWL